MRDRRDTGNALTVALLGNPNVGKSSLFNAMTGLRQHTGNWNGKTVDTAIGKMRRTKAEIYLLDLPGTYSLVNDSAEETLAKNSILNRAHRLTVVICDATALERGLPLALQAAALGGRILVCVNLIDEARRRGIYVDRAALEEALGLPVVLTSARSRASIRELTYAIEKELLRDSPPYAPSVMTSDGELFQNAERICAAAVRYDRPKKSRSLGGSLADRILTGRLTAFPIMLCLLILIFWLTAVGANYPSALLSRLFAYIGDGISRLLILIGTPPFLYGLFFDGVYRVLSFVISVMLPPMAIFFPLFTLLEDVGYLPRVAYNLDRPFCRCGSCGKQALTMCMGFGCNAAGVVGCRIISSPRERLLAILTNSLIPCNGKFPSLTALITLFCVSGITSELLSGLFSSLAMTSAVALGVALTLIATCILSSSLSRGPSYPFILELPPFRRPQICRVIVRSIFDRTLYVLGRAAAVAAPAGAVIWLMANLTVGGSSLLTICSSALDPFAAPLGFDGVMLMAFILGFPANETVLPIALMAYTCGSSLGDAVSLASMGSILSANGWTLRTALSVMLFFLFHWPCSTTVLTIKKETGSLKYALASMLIPTFIGVACCLLFNILFLTLTSL